MPHFKAVVNVLQVNYLWGIDVCLTDFGGGGQRRGRRRERDLIIIHDNTKTRLVVQVKSKPKEKLIFHPRSHMKANLKFVSNFCFTYSKQQILNSVLEQRKLKGLA